MDEVFESPRCTRTLLVITNQGPKSLMGRHIHTNSDEVTSAYKKVVNDRVPIDHQDEIPPKRPKAPFRMGTLSGVPSLVSVCLLATWALIYFGRPFE